MFTNKSSLVILSQVAAILGASFTYGQTALFDTGARFTITSAGGKPTNDIISAGMFGRFRLGQEWFVGVAVDQAKTNLEEPARRLNLQTPPTDEDLDAGISSTLLSAWVEREFGHRESMFKPFVHAGAGVGFMRADDFRGLLTDGGRFDILTRPGTEVVLSGGTGIRARLSVHTQVEIGLRADYHKSEWKFTDRVSGRSSSVGSYHAFGGYLGLSWRY